MLHNHFNSQSINFPNFSFLLLTALTLERLACDAWSRAYRKGEFHQANRHFSSAIGADNKSSWANHAIPGQIAGNGRSRSGDPRARPRDDRSEHVLGINYRRNERWHPEKEFHANRREPNRTEPTQPDALRMFRNTRKRIFRSVLTHLWSQTFWNKLTRSQVN